MFKIILLSHGSLAQGLLAAARKVAGELPEFEAITLSWDQGLDAAESEIRRVVAQVDDGEGVLILTDIFGSTPCNAASSILDPGRVEMVAGVNLPMVLRVACLENRSMSVQEAAEWLAAKGRASIRRVPAPCAVAGERER